MVPLVYYQQGFELLPVAEMVRRYPRRYTRLASQAAGQGAPPRVLIDITLPDGAAA